MSEKTRIHINLTDRQHRILQALAERRFMPVSTVCRIAVERFLSDIEDAAERNFIMRADGGLNG